jgi:hypothetical protein
MANYYATFAQLREAGISLQDWLAFHKMRRASLTEKERRSE